MTVEEENRDILKALEEPVLPNLDDNTIKIRRNLLVSSGAAFFIVLNDIKVSSGAYSGFKIDNISTEVIVTALFFIIFYQLVHFTFNSWDFIRRWRIRATAAKIYFQSESTWTNPHKESVKDPNQSSLYAWWVQRSLVISKMEKEIGELESHRERIELVMKGLESSKEININNVIQSMGQNQKMIHLLPGKMKDVIDVIKSRRIDESLERFDKWFWHYQKDQIFRLAVIEWMLPVLFGIYALYLTFPYDIVLSLV